MVVEGRAARVTDERRLIALAEAWEAKYGADWHFGVTDGMFSNGAGGRAEVFAVTPHGLRLRQGRPVRPDPLALRLSPRLPATPHHRTASPATGAGWQPGLHTSPATGAGCR